MKTVKLGTLSKFLFALILIGAQPSFGLTIVGQVNTCLKQLRRAHQDWLFKRSSRKIGHLLLNPKREVTFVQNYLTALNILNRTRVTTEWTPKGRGRGLIITPTAHHPNTFLVRAAVRDALIEFGIALRQQGKPGRQPAQVPYGFRRADGLLVPHLGEQRVIQSVRKMSNDGLSYRKICDFLTSVGVPTKNRGKGWQPEMVRRLLIRNPTVRNSEKHCNSEMLR